MNTNRFKQLLESTMGNVKPLINEKQYLTEQQSFNPKTYIDEYIKSVKAVMPDYANAEGEKQTPSGVDIFGQTFYSTPAQLPADKQKILSNLGRIHGMVIGKGVSGKELQSSCIPKITTSTKFADGHACYSFQTSNVTKFPQYAVMNTAFNNLYNYINNFNAPTQK